MKLRGMSIKESTTRDTVELFLTALLAVIFASFFSGAPAALGISAILAVSLVPLMVIRPEYGVFALIVLLPVREIHIVSVLYLMRVLIWGLLLRVLLQRLTSVSSTPLSRNFSLFNKAALLFAAALGFSLIQTFYEYAVSPVFQEDLFKGLLTFGILIAIEQFLLVYISYYSLCTQHHLQQMFDTVMLVSLPVSLIAIVQYINKGYPTSLDFLRFQKYPFYGRATSMLSTPNELAHFLAPIVLSAFIFLLWGSCSKLKRFGFLLPVCAIGSAGMLLSFSRSGLLAFFLAGGFSWLLYYLKIVRGRMTWKLFLLLIATVALVFTAVRYYELFWQFRLARSSTKSYYQAMEWMKNVADYGRKHAAIKGFETFIEHPILGIGYGVFEGRGIADGLDPHNQYLGVLVDTGIVGFLPFIGLLAMIFKTGLELWKPSARAPSSSEQIYMLALLSGIICVLLSYLSADTLSYRSNSGILWIYTGSVFVMERLWRSA